jgi:hypothetical protein
MIKCIRWWKSWMFSFSLPGSSSSMQDMVMESRSVNLFFIEKDP